MERSPILTTLAQDYRSYLDEKKKQPQTIRKQYDDLLSGIARSYRPIAEAFGMHVWFWDDDDKNTITNLCSDTGLPMKMMLPFVAETLSEISALDKIAGDLIVDSQFGMSFIKMYQAVLRQASLNISQAQR